MQIVVDKRCVNPRRGNAVAAYVVVDVIFRHRICHRDNGALGHRICKTVGDRRRTRNRRHIENHASAARFHVPDAGIDTVVDALHVDAKKSLEICFRRALNGSYVRNSCVVYEDIDTFRGKHFVKCLPDLRLVRNIAGVSRCLAACGCDLRRDGVGLF